MSNGRQSASSPPRLLICEGREDKFFFERLIEVRNLHRFSIRDAGGRTKFASAINAFRLERPKEFQSLRGILIAADNDDDRRERFQRTCSQIEEVFGPGTAPTQPLQPTRTIPPVTVLMIPWVDRDGHLELLCREAARHANRQIGADVDTFMGLLHSDRWPSDSRRGKTWLRVCLAAACERDPFVPLGLVFRESPYQQLIPVDHPSFQAIADILAKFAP